jgi:hypothetical protein
MNIIHYKDALSSKGDANIVYQILIQKKKFKKNHYF